MRHGARATLAASLVGAFIGLGTGTPAYGDFVQYDASSQVLPNHPSLAQQFPQQAGANSPGFDFDRDTAGDNDFFFRTIDDNVNDSFATEASFFCRNDGTADPSLDRYFAFNTRIVSISADAVISDYIVGGNGNHGYIQVRLDPGADGTLGGAGLDADMVKVVTGDSSTVRIAAPADLGNFHDYTIQKRGADYELYIDGVLQGAAPITLFEHSTFGSEQCIPGTGNTGVATYDTKYYQFDTANFRFVPEPGALALIGMVGVAALRRRRCRPAA